MLQEGPPQLTSGQIASFVESQNRSAASLLAAWQLSRDEAWLREAAEKAPGDPQVAVAMLIHHGDESGVTEWIERLKQSQPENALAYLHAAATAFKTGRGDDALAELAALDAIPQARADLHTQDWQSAMTAAYIRAGHGGLEAEIAAMMQAPLAVNGMHSLGKSLGEAVSAALERGDRAGAARLSEQGMKAASAVGAGSMSLVTQLIGVSMERSILNQMHSFDLIPGGQPQVVVERLAQMDQRIDYISDLIKQHSGIVSTLTDAEFRQYVRRVQVEGELKALEWVAAQRRSMAGGG